MSLPFSFLARGIFVIVGIVVVHKAYREYVKARSENYITKATFYEKAAEAVILAASGLVFIVIGLFA